MVRSETLSYDGDADCTQIQDWNQIFYLIVTLPPDLVLRSKASCGECDGADIDTNVDNRG